MRIEINYAQKINIKLSESMRPIYRLMNRQGELHTDKTFFHKNTQLLAT